MQLIFALYVLSSAGQTPTSNASIVRDIRLQLCKQAEAVKDEKGFAQFKTQCAQARQDHLKKPSLASLARMVIADAIYRQSLWYHGVNPEYTATAADFKLLVGNDPEIVGLKQLGVQCYYWHMYQVKVLNEPLAEPIAQSKGLAMMSALFFSERYHTIESKHQGIELTLLAEKQWPFMRKKATVHRYMMYCGAFFRGGPTADGINALKTYPQAIKSCSPNAVEAFKSLRQRVADGLKARGVDPSSAAKG